MLTLFSYQSDGWPTEEPPSELPSRRPFPNLHILTHAIMLRLKDFQAPVCISQVSPLFSEPSSRCLNPSANGSWSTVEDSEASSTDDNAPVSLTLLLHFGSASLLL